MEELIFDRENATLAIDGRANAMALLARMIGRNEMLAPILDPLDRSFEPQRAQANEHVFGIELAPNAEPAADMAFVEMHRRRRAAEHPGDLVAVPVRHLGSAMQLQYVARGIVACNGAAGFHRHSGMAADRQLELNHRMRGLECALDIAIALAHHSRLGRAARKYFRRLLFSAEDGEKLLDLHFDKVGSVFRHVLILGKDKRQRLADIAHAILRKHGLAIGLQSLDGREANIDRRNIRHIVGGPDRVHAGQCAGLGGIDRKDTAVRAGRADDAHMQLLRETHVRRKAAAPRHQRRILEARNGAADEPHQRDRVSAA